MAGAEKSDCGCRRGGGASAMRGLVLTAAVAALAAFAPMSASAHVTVRQVLLEKDEAPEVALMAPNEEDDPVIGVAFDAPPEFAFLAGEAKSGWKLSVRDRQIAWVGGTIPAKGYTTFSFRMVASGPSEKPTLQPTFTLAGGRQSHEDPVPLDLTREAGGEVGGLDSSTKGLVYVVAAVAPLAFVMSVAAFFLALRVWLEPRRNGELSAAETETVDPG